MPRFHKADFSTAARDWSWPLFLSGDNSNPSNSLSFCCENRKWRLKVEGEGGRKYLYKKCSAHLGFTRLGGGGGRGWKLACPDGLEQALPLAKKCSTVPIWQRGVWSKAILAFFLQRNFPLSAIGNMVHRQQRVESLSITCFANNWSTPDLIPLLSRTEKQHHFMVAFYILT